MKMKLKSLTVFQLSICLFFLIEFLLAFKMTGRAGVLPKGIGAIGFLLGIGDIILSYKKGEAKEKKQFTTEDASSLGTAKKKSGYFKQVILFLNQTGERRIITVFLLMLLYIAGLHFIGYIISSLVMILLVMKILGVENKKLLYLGPVLTVLILYLFFSVLLGIKLPSGLIFKVMMR